jgi:hypothetical protein
MVDLHSEILNSGRSSLIVENTPELHSEEDHSVELLTLGRDFTSGASFRGVSLRQVSVVQGSFTSRGFIPA